MAVTGKFIADWESFYNAVDKAEVKLVSFEDGAHKAESSLNRMVDSFSGRKVIQEATLMAEAIERGGGTSKLTGSELARVSSIASAAAEKMKALGEEVPPQIQKLATAATDAKQEHQKMLDTIGQSGSHVNVLTESAGKNGTQMTSLMGQWRQFDNVLDASGVHIGAQAKGLIQIAEASGKTTSEFGLMGTAGLAVGAVMGGWEIGRWIAGVFDLDTKIAGLTSRLMGWGNVAEETGGAKQDVINRAIANGARETITYTEAIKFNADHQQHLGDVYVASGQKLADAHKELRALTASRREEILRAQENGASEEQLHRLYGISADALKVLVHQKEVAAEQSEKLRQKHDAETQAAARQAEQYNKETETIKVQWEHLNKLADLKAKHIDQYEAEKAKLAPMIAMMGEYAKKQREAADWEKNYMAAQEEAAKANDKIIAQQAGLKKSTEDTTKAVADSSKAYSGVAQQITITGDAIERWIDLMIYSAKVNAILNRNGLFTTQSQLDEIARLKPPGRADGGPIDAGRPYLVGERGPEIIVPGTSGTVLPNGVGASGGGRDEFHLHFHGSVVSSLSEFKLMVKNAVEDARRSSGRSLAFNG